MKGEGSREKSQRQKAGTWDDHPEGRGPLSGYGSGETKKQEGAGEAAS